MAVDRVLLHPPESARSSGTTLRFYGWVPAAVSLGRFQPPLSRRGVEYCRAAGIRIVRRPTGGGGVLHADEVTYSISGRMGNGEFPRSVIRIYRCVAAALIRGLARLGVEAGCGPDGDLVPPGNMTGPCFSRLGRWEIRWQERKLIGSAQARSGDHFLQHGSIPIQLDRDRYCRVFGIDPAGAGEIPAVSLQDALGRVPDRAAVLDCLRDGFREEFGIEFRTGGLSAVERRRVSVLSAGLADALPAIREPADAPGLNQ